MLAIGRGTLGCFLVIGAFVPLFVISGITFYHADNWADEPSYCVVSNVSVHCDSDLSTSVKVHWLVAVYEDEDDAKCATKHDIENCTDPQTYSKIEESYDSCVDAKNAELDHPLKSCDKCWVAEESASWKDTSVQVWYYAVPLVVIALLCCGVGYRICPPDRSYEAYDSGNYVDDSSLDECFRYSCWWYTANSNPDPSTYLPVCKCCCFGCYAKKEGPNDVQMEKA